jgi:hypothetical protein
MKSDPKILSEQYVRGRMYSFIRFKKYLQEVANIFCEEFQYDKDDIIEVSLSDDGKTVWVHFDSGTIGFASELLWDKNVRETFRKQNEPTYPY